MSKSPLILYCDCSYTGLVCQDAKDQVLKAVENSGVAFEVVPDLCELAARRDPILKRWAMADPLKIVACYPRGIKWLFEVGQGPLQHDNIEFLNMRADSAESIIASLLPDQAQIAQGENIQVEKTSEWVPWFPVIDYGRCVNCKQCMNFCLFGVYVLSQDDKVEVQNPTHCKTNCPACARICPQTAIIFPKHDGSPINGDEPTNENAAGEKTQVNLNELLDGDIHDIIRKRGKGGKLFAAKPGQSPGLSNIKDIQEKLGIPADVLASLSGLELDKIKKNSQKGISDSKKGEDIGE